MTYLDREQLGRLVRRVWIDFCKAVGDTKESHLAEWEDLGENEREVDRLIGESVAVYTLTVTQTRSAVDFTPNPRRATRPTYAELEELLKRAEAEIDDLNMMLGSYIKTVETLSHIPAPPLTLTMLQEKATDEPPVVPI